MHLQYRTNSIDRPIWHGYKQGTIVHIVEAPNSQINIWLASSLVEHSPRSLPGARGSSIGRDMFVSGCLIGTAGMIVIELGRVIGTIKECTECQAFCPGVGIGFPPPPHPLASVATQPPFWSKGGGGIGGPHSDEGKDTLVLYTRRPKSDEGTDTLVLYTIIPLRAPCCAAFCTYKPMHLPGKINLLGSCSDLNDIIILLDGL